MKWNRALDTGGVVVSDEVQVTIDLALVKKKSTIARDGHATLHLDLAPGRDIERLHRDLEKPRAGRTFSEHLRRQAGISGVKGALLHEALEKPQLTDARTVARTLKRLPLTLLRPRPIGEAISSAGGVRLEALETR